MTTLEPPTKGNELPAEPAEPATSPSGSGGALATVGNWLDERTGWKGFAQKNLDEPLPAGTSWWQTLGSLLLLLLAFQFVTGFALAMYYASSPDHAYESVKFIMDGVTLGAFIRGLHHWGSTFIVVAVGLHMLRVFFWGAYKKPRELTWIVGVLILQVILGFSFTGYLLPWDQKAYWATVVGTRIAGTVPFIGDAVMHLMRGGPDVGALTLTRFYAVHIMLLPAALIGLVGLHLYLVRRHHIAGPVKPMRGGRVPFFPQQVLKDGVVALVVVGLLIACAVYLRPELMAVADPTKSDFDPRPEWYFLSLFELLKLIPSHLEIVGTLVLPGLLMIGLILLPWLDRTPSRHPAQRRLIIDIAILLIFGVTFLTLKGILGTPPPPPTHPPVATTARAPAPSPPPAIASTEAPH